MTLTLTMLRWPETVSAETRQIAGGTLTIGRASDNDWVLTDPARHLSKRHCIIALHDTGWELADLSANGTFLNRDPEAIGTSRTRDLRDGDVLSLGPYEMQIRIAASVRPKTEAPADGILGPLDPPLPDDLFAGPSQSDHTPVTEDAFCPSLPFQPLDEDWDLLGDDPSPARPAALADPPVTEQAGADLLAAFLRGAGLGGAGQGGAGLGDVHPADPVRAMESLGGAFRAMVSGLRAALVARAATKSEFRIAQTMIRAEGNNPLKFAAGDDDALLALLGVGRRSTMEPAAAVSEALDDIRLHELATMTAMQSALRALLDSFAPARLREAGAQGGLNIVPTQRKLRAWDLFEAQHARLSQAMADDFDSAIGRGFARAYEQALHEAQSARQPIVCRKVPAA